VVSSDHSSAAEFYAFGSFRLYPAARVLKSKGETVKLGARAFDVLVALVSRAGEVISQRELLDTVWPNLHVEEISLRVHIAALRKALDKGSETSHLANVPGRGYSFAVPVSREKITPGSTDAVPVTAAYRPLPLLPRVIGREDAVRQITAMLRENTLVTVVGPGGMGKSTAALAVAHSLQDEFGGRICFIELGSLKEPSLLRATVASALGLPVQNDDPAPQIISHLASLRTLLVFDCVEHLLFEAAALTELLHESVRDLHILITSREALRATCESVYRLEPLKGPPAGEKITSAEAMKFPAVQLFVERVTRGGTQFELTDADAPVVVRLCQRLDGIALALELAAGRVAAYGLKEVASRLDSDFALRWPGRRTAPPRHQTLAATLDWSHELLSLDERVALRRLSVFAGTFTLEAAEFVAGFGGTKPVPDSVSELSAKSLLSVDFSGPVTRYRLLDTTRLYAATKAADAGETGMARRRHAEFHRDHLRTASDDEKATTVTADIEDIRAALEWSFGEQGDLPLAVDLAAYSGAIFLGKALFAECIYWMRRAKAVLPETKLEGSEQQLLIQTAGYISVTFGSVFLGSARTEWIEPLHLSTRKDARWLSLSNQGPWVIAARGAMFEEALERARAFVEMGEQASSADLIALGTWMLGTTLQHMGRLDEARPMLQRAIDLDTDQFRRRRIRDTGWDCRTAAIAEMAHVLGLQGFHKQAREWSARGLAEARLLGIANATNVAMAWSGVNSYLYDPDLDAVEHDVVELLEHARARATPSYEGVALCILGLCQIRRSDFAAAEPLVVKGLELCSHTGYRVFTSFVRAQLCEALLTAGEDTEARAMMDMIDAEECNTEYWSKPDVLRVKGLLARAAGNDKDAEAQFAQSIDCAQKQGALSWELRSAMDLARLWAARGRGQDAVDLVTQIRGKFREGFETIDLIAAREFLGPLP
jgi:predicted ATPase/DNA-binding winged helix-turn-helix (wHTH) protein